jgi:hypothetical protein
MSPRCRQAMRPRPNAVSGRLKPVCGGRWLPPVRRMPPRGRVRIESRTRAPPRASSRLHSRVRPPPPFRGLRSGRASSSVPRPTVSSRRPLRNPKYPPARHAAPRLHRRQIPRCNGRGRSRRPARRLHLRNRRPNACRFREGRSIPCRVSLPRPIALSRLPHRSPKYPPARHAAPRLRLRQTPRCNGRGRSRRPARRLHLRRRRPNAYRLRAGPRSSPCRVSLPVAFRRKGVRQNRREIQSASPPRPADSNHCPRRCRRKSRQIRC